MANFEERDRAFEAKFAHDEELRFLVKARRDKLFAGWAADRLSLPEADRVALVASVISLRDGGDHDAHLIDHIAAAFQAHGRTPVHADLAVALADCHHEALEQLKADHSK